MIDVRLSERTDSQRRMLLSSLFGKRARLTLRSGRELDVIIEALCSPLTIDGVNWQHAQPEPIKKGELHSLLLCRLYSESELIPIPHRLITRLQEQEWPITDPRHPDYEAEATIVRPLPRRNA